jgi:predicted DNA-binding transcriptional regulator AlpA
MPTQPDVIRPHLNQKYNFIEPLTDSNKLLDLPELACILGRSAETIRKDLRRKPEAVPPRLLLPGTRLLRWRLVDVTTWLAMHVEGARK